LRDAGPPSMGASAGRASVFSLPPLPRPSTPSPFRDLFHLRAPELAESAGDGHHGSPWASMRRHSSVREDGRSHYSWRAELPDARRHRHRHQQSSPSSVCSEERRWYPCL
jgi:hypothetical protein